MAGNRRNGKKLRGCAIFCAGGRDLEGGKIEPTTFFFFFFLMQPLLQHRHITYNTITSLLRKLFTTILTYIDVTLTSQTGYLHHLQISIYMITTCY